MSNIDPSAGNSEQLSDPTSAGAASEQSKAASGAPPNKTKYDVRLNVLPHRWKPGQSGNPGGRPSRKKITDELERLMNETPDGAGGKTVREILARAWVQHAMKGKSEFMRLLLDRFDGVLAQRMAVGLADEAAGSVLEALREMDATIPRANPSQFENGHATNGHANGSTNGHAGNGAVN